MGHIVLNNDALKPSKLENHLRKCHPDKTDKDWTYFKTLKEKLQKRTTQDSMFASTSKRDYDGLWASYSISQQIAKSGKPHTIGEELILLAAEEVLKTVLHKPAYDIVKRIFHQLLHTETVLEFLDAKDPILKENLIKQKPDIAYLTDLFAKFNEVNLQLQGDRLNLIKAKSIIAAFLVRINVMKQNIGWREFSQFSNLSLTNVQDGDILVYVQHLSALHTDFKTRFEDVLTMEIPQWIINPY
ncbi:hypothetical protein JRQ81_013842, partial [Phrynocephalus forsythii]